MMLLLVLLIWLLINHLYLGKWLGFRGIIWMNNIILGVLSFLMIYILHFSLIDGKIYKIIGWKWMFHDLAEFYIQGMFDYISVWMLFLVIIISFLVHIYSSIYLNQDPWIGWFLNNLILFTLFMVILIISENGVILFLGWEGVGWVSYLLISYWSSRNEAIQSASKAMILNRIGDAGVIVALSILNSITSNLSFSSLFSLIWSLYYEEFYGLYLLIWVGLFLYIGVMGKSAQLGLHTWLTDAMEGPTPVSALLHAATMVTAGVYLLIKFHELYTYYCFSLLILISSLTCTYAAWISIYQYDLKKIIAYSTCSQLSYMVLSCLFWSHELSLWHLLNHGFFKSLLFLGAGIIIHANMDEQDCRNISIHSLSLILVIILIGNMALGGIPFLSGYYSKDNIVFYSYLVSSNNFICYISYWYLLLTVFLTVYYSLNILWLSTFNKINVNGMYKESEILSLLLVVLGLFSLWFGGFHQYQIPIEYLSEIDNFYLPEILIFLACFIYIIRICYPYYINNLLVNTVLNQMWFNTIYNYFTISVLVTIYNHYDKSIEKGIFNLYYQGNYWFKYELEKLIWFQGGNLTGIVLLFLVLIVVLTYSFYENLVIEFLLITLLGFNLVYI